MADETRADIPEREGDAPEREGDVLGLGDSPVPRTEADRAIAADAERDPGSGTRRRRADDLAEHDAERRSIETGPDDPRGLHVDR